MFTVEDYIELLAGLHAEQKDINIEIDKSDYNLVYSLGRQCVRAIAFTDRQLELSKQKILYYKDQFTKHGYNIDLENIESRLPLRQIDRSKYIKFVAHNAQDRPLKENKNGWIAVRFVFNKKLISCIEKINILDHTYDKQNKIHFFPFNEQNVYRLVEIFKDKGFEIDDIILDYYESLKEMDKNKKNYIPGIYGLKIENLTKRAVEIIISDIGTPDNENLALLKDRQHIYGLEHFDQDDLNFSINQLTSLSQKIVRRTSRQVLVDSSVYNFDRIAECILELQRHPVLIVLDNRNDFDSLVETYRSFQNIFMQDDFSVLYRKNNDEQGTEFNQYIQQNNLNNSLDISSKIVYTNKEKFPKTILKSDWKPKTAIMVGSTVSNQKLMTYLNEVDLVIHYDTDVSPFLSRNIEKL